MKKFRVTLDDKKLNKTIKQSQKKNPVETVKAVHECLLDLAGESARRAPIESADLRNDCHAELNGRTVYEKQASKGLPSGNLKAYGKVGYSLPYALRQHEELDYRHDRTDGYVRPDGSTVNMVAGGEAKYLERPWEERKGRYIQRIKLVGKLVLKK